MYIQGGMVLYIKDFMIRNMTSVCDCDTLEYAIELMQKTQMTVLPVVDKKNIYLGSIYSRNLLKNILPEEYGYLESARLLHNVNQAANNLHEIRRKLVKDYMSKKVIALKDSDEMKHVAEIMLKNKESVLFITNEIGRLRGYINRGDLLYYLLKAGE